MINPDITRALLALATIIIFSGVLVLYMVFPLTAAASENVLMFMFGVLAANFNQVYQYFFGSSQGSKDKDDALIGATKK